jgi:hypothetical protein
MVPVEGVAVLAHTGASLDARVDVTNEERTVGRICQPLATPPQLLDVTGSGGDCGAVPYTQTLNIPAGPAPSGVAPPVLPAPTGAPPKDEQAARDAIIKTFVAWGAVGTAAEAEAAFGLIDDSHGLRQPVEQAVHNFPYEVSHDVYRVSDVRFLNAVEAAVVYDMVIDGAPRSTGRVGRAVLIDGKWKLTRGTVCNDLAFAGASCPP